MKNTGNSWSLSKRSAISFILMTIASALLIVALFISIYDNQYKKRSLVLCGVLTAAVIAIIFFYYKFTVLPFRNATKIIKLFNSGYDIDGIFNISYHFSKDMKYALRKIQELIDRNHAIKVSEKQAEYLALQNQINPHFLYNTLEAIRGEALSSGMSSIADMTETLATFFRYSISNVETLVTVEDEIRNLDNYFVIQQYRFGDKLNLSIQYDEDDIYNVLEYNIPKLILQPIVENAIYHGLECKVGKGTVKVNIETTQSRLIINIIDDGVGIEEKNLEKLNNRLHASASSEDEIKDRRGKGGIALVNVNNRIKLLFGEQYGITVSSITNIGTDVEITLPLIKAGVKVGNS
ncbi:sensor histidine kinase [Clostridium thermarum]|uniref:sensor histidine kinase n=1 Tax=Clostridium thermarum TaxID=1716543 RepID=UPI001FAC6AE7|nr:sensor histidine kinase [Clostridium thermarum]